MNKDINLNNFEEIISQHILNRAYQYYLEGRVTHLSIDNNLVNARVKGSQTYEIHMVLDKANNLIEYSCTCPYDQGPYCKHLAAVFYSLNEDQKTESGSPDLRTILNNKSKESLIDMIIEMANDDETVYQRCLINEETKDISSLIDSYIDMFSSKGYIEYRDIPKALKGFDIALRQADSLNLYDKISLYIDIIFKYVNVCHILDDSDGYLSSYYDEAVEGFNRAIDSLDDKNKVQEISKRILDFISSLSSRNYPDQIVALFYLLLSLTQYSNIRKNVLNKLTEIDQLISKTELYHYYKSQLLEIHYLILKNEDEEKALSH